MGYTATLRLNIGFTTRYTHPPKLGTPWPNTHLTKRKTPKEPTPNCVIAVHNREVILVKH